MIESWLEQLHTWHDFYVIVGSSAAGLTGLMFVVVSLGPNVISARGSGGVRGFVTPVVVFFATVLVISALMSMPAISTNLLAAVLALGGGGGLIYMIWIGVHKTWRQSSLDRLDWCWYVALPIVSYLLILGAAVGIRMQCRLGLEVIGGTVILLLIVGIRNAWDLVLWMAQQSRS